MRRSCLLGLATALSLVGCAPAPTSREVVVYTSVDQRHAEPILDAFEKRSGIRVRAVYDVEATKTTGLANRILAEVDRPVADVFWNGEMVQTLRLKAHGAFAPYASAQAKDFPAEFRDPDAKWTGFGPRYRVWMSVPAFPPRTIGFEDLAKLDLPGNRIAISMPLFGTGSFQAAALFARLGDEKAAALYQSYLDKGVRFAPGNATVRDWVVAGQVTLGLTDSDDACGAIRKGAKAHVFLPRETLAIPQTVALIAGAPHPETGRALIDHLLGPDTERALIESGFAQVALHKGSPPGCLDLPAPKVIPVDPKTIAEHLDRAHADLKERIVR
ncbi:MAG: substrate-binding domain-containing protein [Fimbriimonadaceae bacterium]|nr:substrate-binding domain-containing protein [Fimbriimonadaceae bacterium]